MSELGVIKFPKIRCYDNGEKIIDRYTIVLLKEIMCCPVCGQIEGYECIAMSKNPNSPQGYCQIGSCKLGKHLGKQVEFSELPEKVKQKFLDIMKEENYE